MPIITPRGQAAPLTPAGPVSPTPAAAPAARLAPGAADMLNGQVDRGGGGATPSAADQPPGVPQGDKEAERMRLLAQRQAHEREQQRQRKEREAAAQAERERIATERAAEQRELAALRAKLGRLKTDPYGVMLDEGLTADQAAALLMQQPDVPSQQITLLQQQLAAAQAQIEELRTGQTEQQNQSRESARVQIRHDVKNAVQSDPSLEALKHYGDEATEAVVRLIEQTFDAEGYVMDTMAAIQEVEEYLVEQSLAAASIGKVKARLTPAEAAAVIEDHANATTPAPAATAPGNTQQKPQMKTLSSAMVPQAAKITAADRRQRAILAFQGKLA